MSHYFSEKQEVKSDKKIIKYTIENKNFEFISTYNNIKKLQKQK